MYYQLLTTRLHPETYDNNMAGIRIISWDSEISYHFHHQSCTKMQLGLVVRTEKSFYGTFLMMNLII